MKKFKRVYHPYQKWEEIRFNMWGESSTGDLEKAIGFTSNHKLYGFYMIMVVNEWPVSCENALTDYSLNRKAWIGHAAAALAHRLPEHVTRKAWRYLTNEQRFLANKEASRAIRAWENMYFESQKLRENMGGSLL